MMPQEFSTATLSSLQPLPAGLLETAHVQHNVPDVLVIEDDRISRRALAHLLDASGYCTAAVASGEDALRLIRERGGRGPRLALVDLELPGINGLELIERLRKLTPGIIPVMVTALGD